MSIADIKLFLKSTYPFELLTSSQIDEIIENTEIVYYKQNQKIEDTDKYIYIIVKGAVAQKDSENKEINFYGEKDSFDLNLIVNHSENSFFSIEESILYRFPIEIIKDIASKNIEFYKHISKTVKEKLTSLASENPYLFARIKDIPIQPPLIINHTVSIWQAVKEMTESSSLTILVGFGKEFGIVTDSDLRKKVILEKKNTEDPIGDIATRKLISVKTTDFLFDAIIVMMKHNIKRVVVKDEEDKIVGVLNEVDILSQYSNQPQFIAIKIEKSKSIDELKNISQSFVNTVRILHREGLRTRHIMRFVSEINEKIFKKLFDMLALEKLKENSCLIVMGSEGRQEQILKTDQDNGLILVDGFEDTYIEDFAIKFNQALKELGYPECKGNIMITNKYWRKSISAFKESIFEYINNINPDNMLKLAILVDLKAVAGKTELAEELIDYIFNHISDNKTFLSWFALPAIQFKTPLNMFSRFETEKGKHKNEIDLKKGGIFPIIHGIRSLAIEYRIKETNTFSRIKELSKNQVLKEEFAKELIESLEFMLTLRLRERLKKIEAKLPVDDYININTLSNLEKDLLKESFRIVNRFKDFIINHYKLNYIS
ncbi:MAG: putative nucleotidyltransferase substrate binding domain-containing protein [Hydrogenothermaceae bacterium]